ncbi:MAG: hypothetical protein ABS93_04105 [Thiobacillus sp. SCN 62-729]|nr:MAG: hypothetical protein ABS93_04105 [Thiobacillus sp. SCN 62-729]
MIHDRNELAAYHGQLMHMLVAIDEIRQPSHGLLETIELSTNRHADPGAIELAAIGTRNQTGQRMAPPLTEILGKVEMQAHLHAIRTRPQRMCARRPGWSVDKTADRRNAAPVRQFQRGPVDALVLAEVVHAHADDASCGYRFRL